MAIKRTILLGLFLILLLFLSYHYVFQSHSRTKPKIHAHGYWISKKVKHKFDLPLAEEILCFFQKQKVTSCADFGSGAYGYYVHYFHDHGLFCEGFDGNPFSPTLSQGSVQVVDLSQPLHLPQCYDWVISIEVGEHLPPQFETTFIENLDRHNTQGLILSWALEGQTGRGHCNCHNNDYIKNLLARYGYSNDLEVEKKLREKATLPWLKKTLMVFRKTKS